jgi:hypothetical protein
VNRRLEDTGNSGDIQVGATHIIKATPYQGGFLLQTRNNAAQIHVILLFFVK